jgi:hypothetical protein
MIYTNEGAGTSGTIYRSGGFSAQGTPRTRAVPKGVLEAALNAPWLGQGGLQLQTKGLRGGSAGGQAPQVDGQTSGRRHRQPAFGALANATAQLLEGRVVGLPAHQPPDHLDEGVTHRRVAAPVDVTFTAPAIAVVDAGAQAGVTANLTTVLEALPPADFQLERHPA